MPPAKKAAQKPNKKDSEQSVSTDEDSVDLIEDHIESTDDPIAKINQEKVMVFMKNGYSFSSPDISFTRDNPFQLMNAIEAARLVSNMGERFEYATKEQVEEFYSLG